MLRVDIRHRFGKFDVEAAFEAPPGITALFGRSGAGKTSLITLLAGLARPDHGRIALDGDVLFDSAAGTFVPPERRRLGYVFQDARLFPHMTVRGNLCYGMKRVPRAERHQAERLQTLDDVVDLLDIAPLLDRRPGALSGGEKQRVAIGRALLASPRLLLMDEPLANLDAPRKNEILPYIERLRDRLGLPIVYVSHAMDEVIRLADTMVLLSDGRAVAAGTVEDIMSRLDLRPLTGRYEAGAVIAAVVDGQLPEDNLTRLAFAGQTMLVPRLDLADGATLRMRVRARDVSISLDRPRDISILNVLEGTVSAIEAGDGKAPQVDVLLDVGVPLIARITRRSARDLGLAPGRRVFALIKTVAIDRQTLGWHGARRRNGKTGGSP